jgi:hypothetical protein
MGVEKQLTLMSPDNVVKIAFLVLHPFPVKIRVGRCFTAEAVLMTDEAGTL